MAPSSSMREFGPLIDGEDEARPREPSQALGGAALRLRSAALVVGAVVGLAAVLAIGGPSTAKFLARRHVDGVQLVLADRASTSDPFPWGSVMVPECGVDYRIEKVVHSNLGGQGPDHGEEGIVYRCTQSDNGRFVREVLIKVHALSDYASTSAHKNGLHHDFGAIAVDSGKEVKVRFSIWDLEDKPLTTDTFRITFYDLDEGPHGTSKEYIIADNMQPDAQRTGHSQVLEKTVNGNLEFHASQTGNVADNPIESHHLSELQKQRSVVVEYQDTHYFDLTMGATPGHSPRGFAFALHSALACHDVKRAITTTFTTTQTFIAASPEHRAALMKFLSASAKIRDDDGDMSIPDLFKSRAANPSRADEGDEVLDASEVRQICQKAGEDFSPEDAESVIEDLDADGDGKVDSSEAKAAMQFYEAVSKFSNNRVDVSEAFQGKEQLDAAEVRNIYKQAGEDVSPEEASSLVALLDTDRTGKLSKAELEAHVPFYEAVSKSLDDNNLVQVADLVKSHSTNPSRASKGDELLDPSEVKDIYKNAGEDLSLQEARSRIADFDADGDAKLDKEELELPMGFYKAISRLPENNRNRISDLLENDAYNPSHALEGDEKLLDAPEVRAMGQKAGPKPSLQDASSLIGNLDLDANGQLGIDELAPITPPVPTKTAPTSEAASPEHRAALLKFLSASAKIRDDDGDMSIPDLFKSRAANPSHPDEGDEVLDASEVEKVGQKASKDFSPEDARSVVKDLDANGDGKVDSSEAKAAMQFYEAVSKFSNNRVDVSEAFQGKELLDAADVRDIHLQAGVDVSPEEASSVVTHLDTDGDDKLNKAELEAHVPFVEVILKTLDNNNHMKTADLVKSHSTNPSRASKGDELLDASEVKNMYQEVGEDLSLQEARSRIADFDVDGDAKLDKEELVTPMRFYKAISSMPGNNRNRISDLLKNHAYNPSHALRGDELLDAPEVRAMGQKAGPKPSLPDASSLIGNLDADGDGQLGIDELAPITPFVPPAAVAEPAPFPWWLLVLLALLLLCCLLCLLLLCCQGKEEAPKEAAVPPSYTPVVVQEKAEDVPLFVAAPAPVAPPPVAPPPPYMKLSFADAESKPFAGTWYDKPLGFTYTQDQTPVYVTKVVKGGKAEHLGVKKGMKLTGIEFTGQDMTDVENKSFGDTNGLLAKGTAILPHETDRPYVELTFVRPSREQELLVKTWYTQPLGFTFAPTMPVVVKKVLEGSRAWELGVEAGMEIRSVAYTDMPTPKDVKEETYSNLMDLIASGMQSLPSSSS